MVELKDVLSAARRGEMGEYREAIRYCEKIGHANGEAAIVYRQAADFLFRERMTAMDADPRFRPPFTDPDC